MDAAIFFAVNHGMATPYLDTFMVLISNERIWAAILFIIALVSLYRDKGNWRFLVRFSLILGFVDFFCYRFLKFYFARPRPCHEFELLVRQVKERCGSDFGFPSNHAANSMAIAIAFLFLPISIRTKVIIFGCCLLIGLSRLYLGVHYPGDVLFGFFVGALMSAGLWKALDGVRFLKPEPES